MGVLILVCSVFGLGKLDAMFSIADLMRNVSKTGIAVGS